MSDKILIAMQYWSGDRDSAIRVLEFLADIEPEHSNQADLLIVNRFDAEPVPDNIKRDKLARKFNVFSHRSKSRVVGWPAGCNALWTATMEWAYYKISAKQCPAYRAIFCCEADGGPVFRDWIARLHSAWNALPRQTVIAGAMVGSQGGPLNQHINGNALVAGDPAKLGKILDKARSCPATVGWDYVLADWFRIEGWANLDIIRSYYATPRFTLAQYNKMRADGLAWVHGDKSNRLVEFGRKALLGQTR